MQPIPADAVSDWLVAGYHSHAPELVHAEAPDASDEAWSRYGSRDAMYTTATAALITHAVERIRRGRTNTRRSPGTRR